MPPRPGGIAANNSAGRRRKGRALPLIIWAKPKSFPLAIERSSTTSKGYYFEAAAASASGLNADHPPCSPI